MSALAFYLRKLYVSSLTWLWGTGLKMKGMGYGRGDCVLNGRVIRIRRTYP